jgi:hypothetical protein
LYKGQDIGLESPVRDLEGERSTDLRVRSGRTQGFLLELPEQVFRQDLSLVGKIDGAKEILRRQSLLGIDEEALNRREGVLLFFGKLLLVDSRYDLFGFLDSSGKIALQPILIR